VNAHPSAEQLVAWLDGELPFLRRSRVDRHVRECRECRDRVAGFEATVAATRQLLLAAGERDRIDTARARWKFRESLVEFEPRATPRRIAPLWACLAATVALAAVLITGLRHTPPVASPVDDRTSLAGIESIETAGYRSAVREERFDVELTGNAARPPLRREFRVWSAPARSAYAVRGTDRSGVVRLALYATDGKPGRLPLYQAIGEANGDLDRLEAAFWSWVQRQVWEPVSLAREVEEFSSHDGVQLKVERRGDTAVWHAEQRQGRRAAMRLETGPGGMPHAMEISWGSRTVRITRVGRTDYPSFDAVAAHFRPDAPHRSAIQPAAPAITSPEIEPAAPSAVELRAAEVEALGVLHRLHLCVSDEIRAIRSARQVGISGIVPTGDRRAQLLLLFDALPGKNRFQYDLRIAPEPPSDSSPPSPATTMRKSKLHPAPGEKWLGERLHLDGAGSHRELLGAMNRLVEEAVDLSSHGWALRHLAERFPAGFEQDLPAEARQLLHTMAEDHAIAIQSQISSIQTVFGGRTEASAGVPAGSWQEVGLELHRMAEKSSAALLALFAATDAGDGVPAGSAVIGSTENDLRKLAESAGRLRGGIRAASLR
jgi:hypothetical protein